MALIDVKKFRSEFEQASIDESITLALKVRQTIWDKSKTIAGKKTYTSTVRRAFNTRLRGNVCYWPKELDIDEYVVLVKNNVEQWFTIYDDLNTVKTLILLSILRLSPIEQKEFMLQSVEQRKSDMEPEKRQFIYVQKFLDISASLLNSNSYLKRILGLAGLTGRRGAEIAMTANFKIVDSHHVIFDGQMKTGERVDVKPYQIPLLCDSQKAVDVLASIRRDKPELMTMPYPNVHNRLSTELSKIVKKQYAGVVTIQGESSDLTTKDLRAIYAEICFLYFRDLQGGKPLYFSQILGHSKSDISTALSYDDFHLIQD